MGYLACAPDPRLAPFVESLWIQDEPAADEPCEPTVLLPVGRATLVLEYGDPFAEVDARGETVRLPPALLAGQRHTPARVRALGRTGLVLVNFRPAGAAAFFGPQEDCSDRFVPLEALIAPRAVERGLAEVRAASAPEARLAAVQRFLLRASPAALPDARVVAATERILRVEGRTPIEGLAKTLGLGRRQLARLFARELGLGPKAFARVVRFQCALRRARAGQSWARVAPAAGFQDQAHLTRECAALTGRTPGQLIAGVEERELGRFFNDADPRVARFATYL